MAEGWTRHLWAGHIDAFSAGLETHGLNRYAVEVMAEAGVDISDQESTEITEYLSEKFDYVITVCSDAEKNCPVFPSRIRLIHRGFDDPPLLAAGETEKEKILFHYRRVRDEIRSFIEKLPSELDDR